MRSSNTDAGSYSRPSRRASSAESVYKGLGKEKCCESGGISGNFGGAGADLRPPGGALDEHCFILSRTGGTDVKSAPCLKSERRFRLKRIEELMDRSLKEVRLRADSTVHAESVHFATACRSDCRDRRSRSSVKK